MSRLNPFAKKPTARDALRESNKELVHSARGIEKEIGSLQLEEKKLIAEIKRTARTRNEAGTKLLARQLVRLRQQITSLQKSRAQIRGVATHNQGMHANSSVTIAIKGATKATMAVNDMMAPAEQQKVLRDFQKQSGQLDMMSEMMSDTLDGVLDDEDAEEETEDLTNQVLDEIGIDVASKMASAPKQKILAKKNEDAESFDVDLETKLAALKTH